MNKGVCNLYHYREVALAANRRYLEALAVVDDPAPAYRQVEELTEPVVVAGRSHAGFNPASRRTCGCSRRCSTATTWCMGFRNADIREMLYGASEDPGKCRRQEHGRGTDVEAIACAWTHSQGATQSALARQSRRPSGTRGGRATVSLRNPCGCRNSSMIRPKHAHTVLSTGHTSPKTSLVFILNRVFFQKKLVNLPCFWNNR